MKKTGSCRNFSTKLLWNQPSASHGIWHTTFDNAEGRDGWLKCTNASTSAH